MKIPSTLTYIGGIKAALVNNHNEAFYWWWKSKLEKATLFHVDGHDDMDEANVNDKILSENDYRQLTIANFICPAVYHGVVSWVYWLNPHSEERPLNNYGRLRTFFSERKVVDYDLFKLYKYGWGSRDRSKIDAGGKILPPDKVSIPKKNPLILDIDLDAFCCHRKDTLSYLPDNLDKYDSTLGFKGRIDKTMGALAQLPKPDLITIASSLGDGREECFVPPFMVDEVGLCLANNLRKIYQ